MKRFFPLLTILAPAVAAADDAASLAARGHADLKAGRIHDACDAFAQSEHLAASVDTELALAACYDQDGKPASAAKVYRLAADKDPKASRRKTSLAKADKLEARAPKLHFTVRPAQAGLVLKVDGAEVSATDDAIVDTGPHQVEATAPGYEGHVSAPVDREGATVQVVVQLVPTTAPTPVKTEPAPAPAAAAAAAAPEPMPTPVHEMASMRDTQEHGDHRQRNGVILGAAGLAVIAGSVIAFETGSGKFDDAQKLCPNSQCATDADLAKGHSLYSDGRTWREVSIGMGIGGVALVAAGAYLWATHHDESRVGVAAGPTGAEVTYTARF
ncbi:MAG: hypothetical protein JO257_37135 [Deltaproteobacteria bacterium]|nr:hypothetical protein [Deltaproteobacteria bacterium]